MTHYAQDYSTFVDRKLTSACVKVGYMFCAIPSHILDQYVVGAASFSLGRQPGVDAPGLAGNHGLKGAHLRHAHEYVRA